MRTPRSVPEKDGSKIAAYGWTPEVFAADYPVVVRITPTRWRVG